MCILKMHGDIQIFLILLSVLTQSALEIHFIHLEVQSRFCADFNLFVATIDDVTYRRFLFIG